LGNSLLALAKPAPFVKGNVNIGFWYGANSGPQCVNRSIAANDWADIRENYHPDTAAAFDNLSTWKPERFAAITRRPIILHGPVGTGKTTAIRSLASEWMNWCSFDYLCDPDRFFQEGAYMMR